MSNPNDISIEELCALVRLFGDRVRIAPDGSVSIERQPQEVPSGYEEARPRSPSRRDR